jgi:hypothetical protein
VALQCEKWGDHRFTPRRKNQFPEASNADYEYTIPMACVPPISEHEFYMRFYACRQPGSLDPLLPYKRPACAQTSDALSLLPKKKSALVEGGDSREIFWGICARELISVTWVMLYNFVCILPMLIFLIMWLLSFGPAASLQDALSPLVLMGTLLALFWGCLLYSLSFRQMYWCVQS